MRSFLSRWPCSRASMSAAALTVVVWMAYSARADEPAADEAAATETAGVSFYHDVRPILQAACQGCHQPAQPGGGVSLITYDDLFQPGDSDEPSVVPGDVEASMILFQITPYEDDPPLMPKDRDPLTAEEIALIQRWIEAGAPNDTPESAQQIVDADHPPVYRLPPVLTAVEYSPDGSLLAVSGNHEVLLHTSDGAELVARLIGLAVRIESLAFSPDGRHLAVTGGSPGRFGEVQVWNVEKQELVYSVSVTFDTVYGASWSPDGKLIAFGCADNSVRAIEAGTGKQVLFQGAHNDWVLDTVFSTDGSHLVSVSRDRSMKLIEVATERFVDNITSITPGALTGGLDAIDRMPEKDELLVGGADGTPKRYQMYRTKDRKIGDDFNLLKAYEPLPGRIYDLDLTSDGTQFVVGSSADRTGELRVYNTEDGKLVARCEAQQTPVFAVGFHPDGQQVAAAGFDGTVRIFNAATGELVREFVPVPLEPEEVATAR